MKYINEVKSKTDAEYSIYKSLNVSPDINDAVSLVNSIATENKISLLVDDWINLAVWLTETYPKKDIPYRMLALYIRTIPLRNSQNGRN